MTDLRELNERIAEKSKFLDLLNFEMEKVIIGQHYMVDRLLIALLSDGHILSGGCGFGQDLGRKIGGLHPGRFQSDTVYARPVARRRVGYRDLQPEKRKFQYQKRSVFANFVAGGRDQPGTRQGAGRLVGGHAGAPGDDRRYDV